MISLRATFAPHPEETTPAPIHLDTYRDFRRPAKIFRTPNVSKTAAKPQEVSE